MCQNVAPPKCVFIMWLLMHGRLATCSYLQKIGVQVDHVYCLCGKAKETIDHLYFSCELTSAVWTKVMQWCGIRGQALEWEREQVVLLRHCTTNNIGKQTLYRCVTTIMVYNLWKEMNNRRMQGKHSTLDELVKQC